MGAPTGLSLEERFWVKVEKAGDEECWLWQGSINKVWGYGYFTVNSKNARAHRVSYELAYGSIPEGMDIDHRCLNRACVNPRHLRVATKKQNRENLSGSYVNSKSGVRGVAWKPSHNRWNAFVGHNGRSINVGNFKTIEEAEAAVIQKRLELFTHNELDRSIS